MAGVYKRGETFWGRAQRDGREYRFTLSTKNRGVAEKRLRKWLNEMDDSAWGDKPPRPWSAVWERFMREHFPTIKPNSAKRYAVSLKNLSKALDGKNIQNVTTALLSEFETLRRSEGASAPTIRRDLACLSCIMSYCEEWEWIDDGGNIIPAYMRRRRRRGLKEAPGRTRYLSEEEEAAVIAECSEPCRTAAIVSIDTGLREQELLGLTWPQIDFKNLTIRTGTKTKSGKERYAPLSQRSAQILERRPRHFKSEFVFYHPDGKRIARLNQAFEGAVRRAKLKDVRWHDLRRTFGCRRLQGVGCDKTSMQEVSAMLGHSSVAVTEKSYAFLDLEKTAQKAAQNSRTATE
ncbi:MAG: site-specific integrase [Mesorhizobium sp.]|uniref:tyrosine-type recombinase/integrase n=1 Tax=Mesorhizobium sp. TaxID=1871066 RepID=UPI000FE905FE|nr:site-specific integrase [Mesorhizobium sp.]RWO34782.1 MAG: site-specific integrase [Mesorhizobium sp.]